MLFYKKAGVMDARRASNPDASSTADRLFRCALVQFSGYMERGGDVTEELQLYFQRKRDGIKASYFRQRYGRPYFAERND